MQTVNCPQGDNGLCTIPDRTAMLTAERIEAISREDLMLRYGDLDLTGAPMARVEADPVEILETFATPGSVSMPVESALRTAFARTQGSTSLVVSCSCGHVFIVDTAALAMPG